jgi:hypothetical protein
MMTLMGVAIQLRHRRRSLVCALDEKMVTPHVSERLSMQHEPDQQQEPGPGLRQEPGPDRAATVDCQAEREQPAVTSQSGPHPTSGEIVDALDQLFGLMSAVERHFVEALRPLVDGELYLEDGARNVSEWLVERYRLSAERANGYASLAGKLADLPHLSAAYAAGQLSIDQLKPLVRVADDTSDEIFASEGPGWSERQCRTVAARVSKLSTKDANEARAQRHLRLRWEDAWLSIRGRLYGEAGAVVQEALTRLATQAPKDPDGKFEPLDLRLADALEQLSSQYLASEDEAGADVSTVVCHIDAATLAGLEGEAELDGDHRIAAESARRLLCDANFQIVVENQKGEIVGLGRKSRVVPRWLRRQLHRRDGGCRWPGCPRHTWVDRHHIQHWSNGGRTDPDNLLELCRYHHRVLHEGRWSITGDPAGEVRFVSPYGKVLRSRPAPLRSDIAQRFDLGTRPHDDGGGHGSAGGRDGNGPERSGSPP